MRVIAYGALLVITGVVAGCGLVASGLDKNSSLVTPSSSSLSAVGSGSPIAAFQASFYQFATTNCVQCHGASQVPMFASSDVSAAYTAAKPYADFSNPSDSTLAIYAGNGHCGVSNCSNNSGTATAAISIWAAAENAAASGASGSGSSGSSSGGSSGGDTPVPPVEPAGSSGLISPSSAIQYYTTPMPVPSGVPGAGTKFAIMRWNLSNLTPADSSATGDILEVQIQMLTSSTYRITSPKLASSKVLEVAGVHVMIKGANDPGYGSEFSLGLDWNSINMVIPTSTIPNPLPTTSINAPLLSPNAIPMPVINGPGDLIIVGFETLQPGTLPSPSPSASASPSPSPSASAAGCKNLSGTNGFETNVKPQMQSICFNCHLSGGAGYPYFPMISTNDATLCQTTLNFIDTTDPANSEIVLRPQGNDGHPDESSAAGFNPTPFINWISTE